MPALQKLIFTVLLVGALVLVAMVFVALSRRGRLPGAPYERSKGLFSPAELRFLTALEDALGSAYRVFGKVRVADLANVKPGLTPRVRRAALNRVAYKHFDFLVCSVDTCEPLCAVELNDRSHAANSVTRRDILIAQVCEAIALPLVTFPAAKSYDRGNIKDRLERELKRR